MIEVSTLDTMSHVSQNRSVGRQIDVSRKLYPTALVPKALSAFRLLRRELSLSSSFPPFFCVSSFLGGANQPIGNAEDRRKGEAGLGSAFNGNF